MIDVSRQYNLLKYYQNSIVERFLVGMLFSWTLDSWLTVQLKACVCMENPVFEKFTKTSWLVEKNYRKVLYGKTCQTKSTYSIVDRESKFNQWVQTVTIKGALQDSSQLFLQVFPIELKTARHFDESAGVNRKTAKRCLKTIWKRDFVIHATDQCALFEKKNILNCVEKQVNCFKMNRFLRDFIFK